MLPDPMLAMLKPLVILVWSTNAYHVRDLGLTFGRTAFTNDYHRGLGRGIDVSVVGSVVAGMAVW